jgi:hypothetical protein
VVIKTTTTTTTILVSRMFFDPVVELNDKMNEGQRKWISPT